MYSRAALTFARAGFLTEGLHWKVSRQLVIEHRELFKFSYNTEIQQHFLVYTKHRYIIYIEITVYMKCII